MFVSRLGRGRGSVGGALDCGNVELFLSLASIPAPGYIPNLGARTQTHPFAFSMASFFPFASVSDDGCRGWEFASWVIH